MSLFIVTLVVIIVATLADKKFSSRNGYQVGEALAVATNSVKSSSLMATAPSNCLGIESFSYYRCDCGDGLIGPSSCKSHINKNCCSNQPSVAPTTKPSSTPSAAPSLSPSATPTTIPSAVPTAQPSSSPSATPSAQPSAAPSTAPSAQPSSSPSVVPSAVPSPIPSAAPSAAPSAQPSSSPSAVPSAVPSSSPSATPSAQPSAAPSAAPSAQPSSSPSAMPSTQPSAAPSAAPSASPTSSPSTVPSASPSKWPTGQPSTQPSSQPSTKPTCEPTFKSTAVPSASPSDQPSSSPTVVPSAVPSSSPSATPSAQPSAAPSAAPSASPSAQPSSSPSAKPSTQPSAAPSASPTSSPTAVPSASPSKWPTGQPSTQPSSQPSTMPTGEPTFKPTDLPTGEPSFKPTAVPTGVPTSMPSAKPTGEPTIKPTATPSAEPTFKPTALPIGNPSLKPSAEPTEIPSTVPTTFPSKLPSVVPAMTSISPSSSPPAVIVPVINFVLPSQASTCDDLIIDVSSSYGNQGQDWRLIKWTLAVSPLSANIAQIEDKLPTETSLLAEPITIPKTSLVPGNYSFSLSLLNALGGVATKWAYVTVVDGADVPSVRILGPTEITITSSNAITIPVLATPSSCAASSVVSYEWSVASSDGSDIVFASSSRTAPVLSLPSYTLAPFGSYSVVCTVHSSSGSSSATVTVNVVGGNIIVYIGGVSQQSPAVNQPLTIDASQSVDENSPSSDLSFQWTCLQTSGDEIRSCTSIFNDTSSNIFVIPAYTLVEFETYLITVKCSASDGRSSTASMTVIPIPAEAAGVTVVYAPPTSSSGTGSVYQCRVNANSKFKLRLIGNIAASFSTRAVWNITANGAPADLSSYALTPLTRDFPFFGRTGVAFPLAIDAGCLIPGDSYTFRLSVYPVNLPTLIATASFDVIVNPVPSGGHIAISPISGMALSTSFLFTSLLWVGSSSDDYPFQYSWGYLSDDDVSQLQLTEQSYSSFLQSYLPPGSTSNNNSLVVISTVYNTWGAYAQAELSVQVYPVAADIDLNGVFSMLLASCSNPTQVLAAANLVSSTLNSQNCLNQPDCVSLHRSSCSAKSFPNTCGACLPGFVGLSGSSNDRCYLKEGNSVGLPSNASCFIASGCEYFTCLQGRCVVPPKQCPGNCNGKGVCVAVDFSGSPVSSCLASNMYCSSVCSCADGWGGADCGISLASMASRDSTRTAMSNAVLSTLGRVQNSSEVLASLSVSFVSMFNSYEVQSSAGVSSFVNLLSRLTRMAASGYLSDDSTVTSLANAISGVVVSVSFATSIIPSLSNLKDIVADFTHGISTDMVEGQNPVNIKTDSFQMSIRYSLLSDLYNAPLISPPSLGAPTIQLPAVGLDVCDSGSGYLQTSVAQWSRNPYQDPAALASSILRFSSEGSYGSGNSPSISLTPASSSNSSYYITLPFTENFNYNLTTGKFANNSYPECYVKSDNGYSPCSGCAFSSTNGVNVTFVCADVKALCPLPQQGSRRLQADTSQELKALNILEYTSLFKAAGALIQSVLMKSEAPQPTSAVSIFIYCLIAFGVIGGIYFARRDQQDKEYLKHIVQRVREKRVSPLNEPGEETIDDVDQSFFQWLFCTKPPAETQDYNFKESILVRFVKAVFTDHPFMSAWSSMSLSRTRFIRYMYLYKNILANLFINTVIFSILYPPDNDCYTFQTESTCTQEISAILGNKLCQWDATNRSCSLAAPPDNNIVFFIMLGILSSIATLPILFVSEYLLFSICTKRPKLEQIYLHTETFCGEEISTELDVVNTVHAVNDSVNAEREVDIIKKKLTSYAVGVSEDTKQFYYEQLLSDLYLEYNGESLVVKFPMNYYVRSADDMIWNALKKAKSEAAHIQRILDLYGDENGSRDAREKNSKLFRYFLSETFRGHERELYTKNFISQSRDLQEKTDAWAWIASWSVQFGMIAFFLYFILEWGTQNPDAVVHAWGLNYAATFFYALIVQQVIKLFLFQVLLAENIHMNLTAIFEKLHVADKLHSTSHNFADPMKNIVQILSPACRVAACEENTHLHAVNIIRSIGDADASELFKINKQTAIKKISDALKTCLDTKTMRKTKEVVVEDFPHEEEIGMVI